jgi:membrane protease YdiL (CAAX protease family)
MSVVIVYLAPSLILKLAPLRLNKETISGFLVAAVVKKATTMGLILVFLWQAEESLRNLGMARANLERGLLIGLPVGAGILVINALSSNVLLPRILPAAWRGEGEPTFLKEHLGTPLSLLVWIGFSWWAAAFGEELERAFLITRIDGLSGMAVALIVTSLIFGIRHWYQGRAGAAITTGIVGLLFGLVWLMTGGNLVAAMVAHATLDSLALILLYFAGTFQGARFVP